MDLQELRGRIDRVDRQLVDLYRQRMEIVAQISDYKCAHGLPVYDAEREAALLSRVEKLAGARDAAGVRAMFAALLDASRAYQHAQRGE